MFPGYTHPIILDLPYDAWLLLALAYDEYSERMKETNRRRRR